MKIVKIITASFILLVIATAFISKSPAQPFISVDDQLEWDGGAGGTDFVVSTGNKDLLDDAANWESAFEAYGSACTNTAKLCKVRVTYTYTPPTETPITIQEVIDEVYNKYNDLPNPNVFTSVSFNVTIRGIVVSFNIQFKA